MKTTPKRKRVMPTKPRNPADATRRNITASTKRLAAVNLRVDAIENNIRLRVGTIARIDDRLDTLTARVDDLHLRLSQFDGGSNTPGSNG